MSMFRFASGCVFDLFIYHIPFFRCPKMIFREPGETEEGAIEQESFNTTERSTAI